MHLEDYHTHNVLCRHAQGTLRDYVLKGIELDLSSIGLSDHFPYEFLKGIESIPYQEYSMLLKELDGYIKDAENLKSEFKSKIDVKIGFEIDYIFEQEQTLNSHLKKYLNHLDYIIGSVHVIEDKECNWCVDDTKFLDNFNNYGVDNVYLKYYHKLQQMLNSKKFKLDIVGHFDLPKKFNKLPNNKEAILNEVIKTLEIVKKRGVAVEINTAGLRKDVKEQYPSVEIIKLMYNLDIPIVLSSDAHNPNEIAYEFKEIVKILKSIGFNSLASFKKREKIFINL